ncbi:hypothetical protein ACFXKD_22475 [Nocardiopsis aegyptia]|uniref:hypothetical protein n=1 Tax=Nocardiopsis aegyptia TaxID=220378 RepID=UPI00366D9925
MAGGSPRVVTLADPEGFTAHSTADGRALWRVDAADLRRLRGGASPDAYEPEGVHHVGATVLVDFPSALVAFDELTGVPAWCAAGPSEVIPAAPHRFVGLADSEDARWGLFDLADGSLVAELPDRSPTAPVRPQEEEDEAQVRVEGGRATVWRGSSLSVYGLDDGALLFRLDDARPRASGDQEEPYHRSIRAVRTVDGVTVASYEATLPYYLREPGRPGDATDNDGVLAAYDRDGTELWNSAGTGRIAVGDPVVGTSIGSCPSDLGGVFLTQDTARHGSEHTYAVRAEDGTVAWSSSADPDQEERYFSCAVGGAVVDGRLYRPDGGTADAEGHAATRHPLAFERTWAIGDGLLVIGRDDVTFHTPRED